MKKTLRLFILLAFTMSGAVIPAFAAYTEDKSEAGAVDVGNKYCPTTPAPEPVSGKDSVVFQGKRYGLSSPEAKEIFLSSPSFYIEKMEKREAEMAQMPAPAPAPAGASVAPETASESDVPLFPEPAKDTK